MRRSLPYAVLATLLVTACGQDVTTSNKPGNGLVIQATPANSCTPVMTAAQITSDINSLMAVLTPNSQSAQSKWASVQSDLAAHDYAQAQTDLNTLTGFINLKFGQASQSVQSQWQAFKDNLIAGLTCYVSLHSFDINPGDPEKVFVNPAGDAGVLFPEDFVPTGYNIRISEPNPAALDTPLDKYASFINIEFVDGDGNVAPPGSIPFNTVNGVPVVVVCFPLTGMSELAKLRALLGHQASDGFELLPKVTNVPALLANALECGTDLAVETTPVGRFLREAADWLLPQKLYARLFARGGVGGSPEEFSPFGAVDPGLFVGGAGGSPEEFAPPVGAAPAAGGPANSTVSGGGTNVTGTADESDVTDPAQLPRVRVVTGGLGNPIAGVIVNFEMIPPVNFSPTSDAVLCGLSTADTTDAEGYASVPCINFGTKPGYKNLKATFDPTGVDPLACIIDGAGACATATTSRNFLVETTKGAATLNVSPSSPAAVTVGTAVGPLTATVADAVTPVPNPYVGVTVTVTGPADIECLPLAGPANHSCQTATTDGSGNAGFSSLTSKKAGTFELTFTHSVDGNPLHDLTKKVNVTFNRGAPQVSVLTASPAAVTVGTALPALTAKVADSYGNVYGGTTVNLTGTALGCVGGGSSCLGGTTDGTTGEVTFNNVTSTKSGAQTLTFTAVVGSNPTGTLGVSFLKGAALIAVLPVTPAATTVGTAVEALTATVADAYGNPYDGVSVSVSGSNIECLPLGFSADHACQNATTNASGQATFSSLTSKTAAIDVALSFTTSASGASAGATVTFNAGAASNLVIVAPTTPTLGGYGGAFAAFSTVSPPPQVKTVDGFGNTASGSVVWKLTDATVSAGATISGTTGLSVGWTLGDGVNQLNAYLGSIGSGISVTFSATPATAALATLAACSASGTTKKTDLASYSSAAAGFTGYFTTPTVAKGLIRKVQVQMSVTGQSSGTGDYVTTLNAYRRKTDGTRGDLIATGKPNTTVLKLPGNNSSPSAIDFTLAPATSPVVNSVVNVTGTGEVVIFELKITAPSTRTFQMWYNTKPAGACLNSKLFAPSTTVPNFNTGSALAGLLLKVTN